MPRNQSFDRVADVYDQTRGFPPGVAAQAAALIALAGGLTKTSEVLELGVGTGRVALPLADVIGQLHGIDISDRMLRHLNSKRDGRPVRTAQADAAWLPFGRAVFDALVVVHVFHLVPDMMAVEREMRRVLKPDGLLLNCWNTNDATFQDARTAANIAMHDGDFSDSNAGRWTRAQSYLEELGWQKTEPLDPLPYVSQRAPIELLDSLEKRRWSSTWDVDDAALARGVAAMREVLVAHYGDITQPIDVHHHFHVTLYRPPQ